AGEDDFGRVERGDILEDQLGQGLFFKGMQQAGHWRGAKSGPFLLSRINGLLGLAVQ
ncbi:MAG: hypothetical protein K0Q50_1939, partial [Vampirovibrio sp.]|nr:hypothetical protein [Vampirovibrio sp.]